MRPRPKKTGRVNSGHAEAFCYTPNRPHVGRGMQLRDIECVSGGVGARGEGEILYDGTLNLRVNAGPLELMQNDMGAIGDVLGAVTDSLLKYHVTGPWKTPVLEVRPLGIGADESKSEIP